MTAVTVSTPSRLHFGLLRLHESPGRSFGGLGMMIDRPRVELELAAAPEWSVEGPSARRATTFARRALASLDADVTDKPAALRIAVRSIVPQHRGLGGGTQLALAIAAGVRELVGLPRGTAAELAAAVGRGARSAVGSHGFVHGGLIWERGRTRGAKLSDLADRVTVPAEWRVVLASPPHERGLSGVRERRAFDQLPPVAPEVTIELESLAEGQILLAARTGDLDAFGEAVYRYGRRSGECFAPIQGGPYATPQIADGVAAIRKLGVRGVGQSSWGPTVFAIVADKAAASELVGKLRSQRRWENFELTVAAPDNTGAVISRSDSCGEAPSQRTEARR